MKSGNGKAILGFALLSVLIEGSVRPSSVVPSTLKTSHVPLAVKTAAPAGRLPGTQRLNLAIGLPLRNPEGLKGLIQQLYDPSNPLYHRYLTPEEFTATFGPTEADYQAVIRFAQANGLEITATHLNRMLVDVNATAEQLERALHTTLNLYAHPTEDRTFYAPATEPLLDPTLPILHISGLDNFTKPKPNVRVRTVRDGKIGTGSGGGVGVPAVGTGPSSTYWGKDFRKAYAPGVTLDGSGQVVGLFELDGYYARDVQIYEGQAKITKVPMVNVLLDGYDGTPGRDNVEVALDIEMVASMAPGLSAIIVYMAGGPDGLPNDVLNRMATDNLAKQLSASWSYGFDPTTSQIFQEFAAQGQSYFNASGDGGAYIGAAPSPLDNPYITVVGGTTLTTLSDSTWSSETTWDQANGVASGGGISTRFSIPTWQQGVDMSANQGSTTERNSPDVAMIADMVWSIYDNGSSGVLEGTSCGTPLWAGFMALVNQQAAAAGLPPVGFINPAVYAIGLGPGYATNFHDITTGSNPTTNNSVRFSAVPGYDLCTGWGTPMGQNLINSLAPLLNATVISNAGVTLTVEGCSPANGVVDPGETVTISLALKNVGAVPTSNLVAVLEEDSGVISPSEPQNYGALKAGDAPVTLPFTFTATGTCGSNLVATVSLADGTNNLGAISISFLLGKPVNVWGENFDTVRAPAVPGGWTRSISGSVSNWITSTAARDSSPNSAFVADTDKLGSAELVSPPIQITTASAQLIFRQNYNLEAYFDQATNAYDGGVLEIQIGDGNFADILDAGGSFVTGGYNRTILSDTNNISSLNGRSVWSGVTIGFITTVVNLPTNVAGQSVQFKWRLGTDDGNFGGGFGWYIDNLSLQDGYACCSSSANLALAQSISSEPALVGQSLTYTLTVTNAGPSPATDLVLTDALPATASFSSVSSGGVYANGNVVWNLGTLTNGTGRTVTAAIVPFTSDPLTNIVSVSSSTIDPDLTNNSTTLVTMVATSGVPPVISVDLTNAVVVQGAAAQFQVSAVGIPSPAYQWFFNGTNLLGETSPTLSLTNIGPQQAGLYQVTVTNLLGATTSTVAQLTVLVPPKLVVAYPSVAATNLEISLTSISGLTYILEYKNSLTDANWVPILPAIPGTGGTIVLQDTNSPAGPVRFYRVSTLQVR